MGGFSTDLLTFILTLFIPLAIVYFQERTGLTERYLALTLSIRRVVIEIGILVSLTWLVGVLDLLDLPSKALPLFQGKQRAVDFLLSIGGLFVVAEQLLFYIDYFNFKRLPQYKKITLLFDRSLRKLLRVQTASKWIETNRFVDSKLQPEDFPYRRALTCRYTSRQSGVVTRIRTDRLARFLPGLLLTVRGGSFVQENSVVAYVPDGAEVQQKEVTKALRKVFTLGEDYEEVLAELFRVIVSEIKNDIENGLVIQVERSLSSLREFVCKLARTNVVIAYPYEILGSLFHFLRQTATGSDKSLNSIIRKFNANLIVSVSREGNLEFTEGTMDLCLTKEFLTLDDGEFINDGIIYMLTEVLRSIVTAGTEVERLKVRLCRVCLELFVQFTEDELNLSSKQATEKDFLLSDPILHEHAITLKIPFAFLNQEKEIYVDLGQTDIDRFQASIYSRVDKAMYFAKQLKVIGFSQGESVGVIA